MNPALKIYAERLLAGTGIGIDDVPSLPADTTSVAAALHSGWRTATDPIPELPIAPYNSEEQQ